MKLSSWLTWGGALITDSALTKTIAGEVGDTGKMGKGIATDLATMRERDENELYLSYIYAWRAVAFSWPEGGLPCQQARATRLLE